jgi:hypothetical protein
VIEPVSNISVKLLPDDRSRQDIDLPAKSAVPPDGARGAAVTVLDLDAETLKRQASDISIVAHLIAGEPDADQSRGPCYMTTALS